MQKEPGTRAKHGLLWVVGADERAARDGEASEGTLSCYQPLEQGADAWQDPHEVVPGHAGLRAEVGRARADMLGAKTDVSPSPGSKHAEGEHARQTGSYP